MHTYIHTHMHPCMHAHTCGVYIVIEVPAFYCLLCVLFSLSDMWAKRVFGHSTWNYCCYMHTCDQVLQWIILYLYHLTNGIPVNQRKKKKTTKQAQQKYLSLFWPVSCTTGITHHWQEVFPVVLEHQTLIRILSGAHNDLQSGRKIWSAKWPLNNSKFDIISMVGLLLLVSLTCTNTQWSWNKVCRATLPCDV